MVEDKEKGEKSLLESNRNLLTKKKCECEYVSISEKYGIFYPTCSMCDYEQMQKYQVHEMLFFQVRNETL